jgi:hypothetical protein
MPGRVAISTISSAPNRFGLDVLGEDVGIDISPGGAHGSYSGFHRFRQRVAKQAGIVLDEMEGFGNRDEGTPGTKKWQEGDPIVHLLNHSDCDGILTPQQCRECAPRLRELIKDWDIQNDYDARSALSLIEGMETAANKNINMEFH